MKVWLVEDNLELRKSVAESLSTLGGVTLTGCFELPSEAIEAAQQGQRCDVGLIDLGLPGMSGEQLISELLRIDGALVLIALTVRADDGSIFRALEAGAVGYLLKDASLDELGSAMALARGGGAPFSPTIGRRVVQSFRPSALVPSDYGLTTREGQVLELLCTAASYKEVARTLRIAESTVQTHVKRIYDKLGVSSKAEAVSVALGARRRTLGTRW